MSEDNMSTTSAPQTKSDQEIMDIMDQWVHQAMSYFTEKVADERAKALDYYNSKPYGNEIEGRSKVRATEVLTTVEWVKPSLLRIFTGGDEPITISGRGDDDVEQAEVSQAWVDYVINTMNQGFMMYYTWFTDALLQKTGFVKSGWIEESETFNEQLDGISKAALDLLEGEETIETTEIMERDASPEEMMAFVQSAMQNGIAPPADAMEQPIRVYDVSLIRTVTQGRYMIDPIPPEEVLTLRDTRNTSAKGGRFWCHRRQISVSELREDYGYDIPDEVSSGPILSESTDDTEELARSYADSSEWGLLDDDEVGDADPSVRMVWFYECNMRIDDDGDGIAEWVRVHRVANKVLSRERVRRPNISYLTPIPMPHRLVGKSMADLVIPLEDLKTSILRMIMDHLYYTVNPRAEMVETGMGDFTLSDWLNNQPNQPIRVKAQGTVTPFYPPQMPRDVFSMLEWSDQDAEKRTGVSRFNQGLSPDTLNNTATGIVSLINQAVQRIEMIARIFAETGVRDLVQHILEDSAEFPDMVGERVIKLTNGKSYNITPESILGQYDLIVNVGAGSADKGQTLQHVMLLLQTMNQAVAAGAGPESPNALIRWENLYNAMEELVRAMGLKNPSDFITDPDSPEFRANAEKQPPPSPEMVKVQQEGQKIQLQHQEEMAKIQQDGQQHGQEMQLKVRELAIKERELDLKERELELDAANVGSQISERAVGAAVKAVPPTPAKSGGDSSK